MEKLPFLWRCIAEFTLLALSGSLITLALAPFHLWPLTLLAMFILHQAFSQASAKVAMWRGLSFAFGLQLSGNFWVYVSIHDHGGAGVFLASLMTGALCLFLASWLMPLSYFYVNHIRDKKGGSTFGFTAFWLISEWLKTSLLTGFPWLFLGYSQLHAPLHSWAPVIGTFGISFILVLTAACFSSLLLQQRPWPTLLLVISLWLLPLYLNTVQWTSPKSGRAYTVALLQPNIALDDKWNPSYREPIMHSLKRATEKLHGTDLIIWPETAVPDLYNHVHDYLDGIGNKAEQAGSAVILGVASKWYDQERPVYHNSVIAIGKGSGIYHKQKLVPFGEYVPLESWLRGIIQFFDLPLSNFRPGPEQQEPLLAQDLVIVPYICYEIVYPNFVAGSAGAADVLLTISNDAWFGTSIGPIQHMEMAQMRALETGRYIIRDTNNGITAIINPQGEISARVPSFEQHILKSVVYAYQGLTPVTRYGTLPPIILSALILLLLWRLPRKHLPVTG
jgi:apolipoprotein N-acyltransferase